MSASKPILSISKETSELAQIVNTNNIGRNFSEDDLDKMCDFILELKNNPTKYSNMQKASKETSLMYSPENAKEMILD